MSYKITYTPTDDHVTVVTKGVLTVEICEAFMREMVTDARANNCQRFLVDHSKSMASVGLLDAIRLAENPDKFGFTKDDTIAVYAPDPLTPHFIFQDEVVSNGWSFVYFTDLDKAKAWLSSD